jgi:hypothetical protein
MAAVLVASVFLPWYKAPTGFAQKGLSGWATGTWGPVIAFLGLGALAIVALRRLRIPVSLPYPETIVLEAIGWVATLTAIVKARFKPEYETTVHLKVGLDNKIWIAVAAGLALALLAGRASGKTPFVAVPGWLRGRAGKIGLAVLLVIVAGGAAFGLTNKYKPATTSAGGVTPGGAAPSTVRGKLPDCAKGFPVPAIAKPYSGQSSNANNTCVALLTSQSKATDVANAFRAALTKAGYKFTVKAGVGGATVITLTSPRCGNLQIVAIAQTPSTKAIGNSFASLILTPCAGATPR